MIPHLPISFSARTKSGSKRGRKLGFPTVNLNLADIPDGLEEGVYAGMAIVSQQPTDNCLHTETLVKVCQLPTASAACVIHYGPRPSVKKGRAFEVHLIGIDLKIPPDLLSVKITARLRDIVNFKSVEELKKQIFNDIAGARAILSKAK